MKKIIINRKKEGKKMTWKMQKLNNLTVFAARNFDTIWK